LRDSDGRDFIHSVTRTKPSSLNELLKDARTAKNMTQIKAAHAIGHTTSQYISNMERGLCTPSLEMAVRLADHYQIPKRELYKLMTSVYDAELRSALFGKHRR
jgi:DNA-binding XRE family transcriptional regulator